ncbi:MAG: hypothetical protein C0424_10815 [Sphingobacteriaceae bacterium]|nr:hypothetical protein [Sphingobacteriaceae bacterium]
MVEKSRTELLVGKWMMYEHNGDDFLDFEFRNEFKQNNDLYFSALTNQPMLLSKIGTWHWAPDESKLFMYYMDSIQIGFDVLRLTEQELWLNTAINEKWKLVKE